MCRYVKAHPIPTKCNKQATNLTTDGSLKDNCPRAGSSIYIDHFGYRLKGRTYTLFGKTILDKYKGGCVFSDASSSYIHVEHLLRNSSAETIRAKQSYEQLTLEHGVVIENYLAGNGIFKASAFVQHLREHNQEPNIVG